MKKAREFWIVESGKYNTIMALYEKPFILTDDSNLTHVREVLDADPKDEIIKTMRDALKNTFDCLPDELARPKNFCREALAAVDKLEKDK